MCQKLLGAFVGDVFFLTFASTNSFCVLQVPLPTHPCRHFFYMTNNDTKAFTNLAHNDSWESDAFPNSRSPCDCHVAWSDWPLAAVGGWMRLRELDFMLFILIFVLCLVKVVYRVLVCFFLARLPQHVIEWVENFGRESNPADRWLDLDNVRRDLDAVLSVPVKCCQHSKWCWARTMLKDIMMCSFMKGATCWFSLILMQFAYGLGRGTRSCRCPL